MNFGQLSKIAGVAREQGWIKMYEVCGKGRKKQGLYRGVGAYKALGRGRAAVLQSHLPLESDIRGFLLNIIVI